MRKGYVITIVCLLLALCTLGGLIYFDLFRQESTAQEPVDMTLFQEAIQEIEDSKVLGVHLRILVDSKGEPELFRYDKTLDFTAEIIKENKAAVLRTTLTTEYITHTGYYELYYDDGWKLELTDGKPVMIVEKTVYHYDDMDDIDVIFRVADPNVNPNNDQLNEAKTILQQRLAAKNIDEYDIRVDTAKDEIHLRFPWVDASNAGSEKILAELTAKGLLEVYEGEGSTNHYGEQTPPTNGILILNGYDVKSATAMMNQDSVASAASPYIIDLELNENGTKKLSAATQKLAATKGTISIWLDQGEIWARENNRPRYALLFSPTVESPITDGGAIITGFAEYGEAKEVADLINCKPLPFEIAVAHLSIIKAEDK